MSLFRTSSEDCGFLGSIKIDFTGILKSVTHAGFPSRRLIVRAKGLEFFETRFIPKFKNITIVGLLLTLVVIFEEYGVDS